MALPSVRSATAWRALVASAGWLLLAAPAPAQDVPSEDYTDTTGADATTERGADGIFKAPGVQWPSKVMQAPPKAPVMMEAPSKHPEMIQAPSKAPVMVEMPSKAPVMDKVRIPAAEAPAIQGEASQLQKSPAFGKLAMTLAAPAWVARHGLTPSQYQTAFDDLAKQGFRLIQVSGYTRGGEERYAALWEKSAGAPWVARHGMSSADYQAAFTSYANQGYRLVHVSGWQAGGQDRFAAIWEQRSGPAWVARHGLSGAQYQQAFDDYARQGYRLIHVDGWGAGNADRYAAIWEQSPGPAWVARHGLDGGQYQQAFDEYASQGFRLKEVSGYEVAGRARYAAIWEKTGGPVWMARHGIPGAHYQHVFDNQAYQGYRLVHVDAFASGNAERFNAIWTNQIMSGADLALIAGKANGYLSAEAAPGLALAIAKDGRLVYAAGFGVADKSSGEGASATHQFRIASVSKPITSVAIMRLVEQNQLDLGRRVFGQGSILGARFGTPAANQQIDQIAVRQLLQHVAGFSNTGGDPMFQNTGMSHDQLIPWALANKILPVAPGTRYDYSNFGYCLLGRIIEQVSGQGYEAFVRANVLTPSGVTGMVIANNAADQRRPNEVAYYPASAYDLNVRRFDSHGGWIATPIDLVRLLVHVDGLASPPDILSAGSRAQMVMAAGIADVNGNDPNYALGWTGGTSNGHNGAMTGTLAVMVRKSNGFSYAALVNTRPANDGFAGKLQQMMDDIVAGVSAWPAHDLF